MIQNYVEGIILRIFLISIIISDSVIRHFYNFGNSDNNLWWYLNVFHNKGVQSHVISIC